MLYFFIKDIIGGILRHTGTILAGAAIILTPYILCYCAEKHADHIYNSYLHGCGSSEDTQNSLPPTYN